MKKHSIWMLALMAATMLFVSCATTMDSKEKAVPSNARNIYMLDISSKDALMKNKEGEQKHQENIDGKQKRKNWRQVRDENNALKKQYRKEKRPDKKKALREALRKNKELESDLFIETEIKILEKLESLGYDMKWE